MVLNTVFTLYQVETTIPAGTSATPIWYFEEVKSGTLLIVRSIVHLEPYSGNISRDDFITLKDEIQHVEIQANTVRGKEILASAKMLDNIEATLLRAVAPKDQILAYLIRDGHINKQDVIDASDAWISDGNIF